jgi:hypothetical protein
MSTEKITLTRVTPELIQDCKAKYSEKRLRLIEVKSADGSAYEFLLRKPNKNVIDACSRLKGDVAGTNKILIANCVLGGDNDAFENDGDVYGEVMKQLGGFMKGATSSIKKL